MIIQDSLRLRGSGSIIAFAFGSWQHRPRRESEIADRFSYCFFFKLFSTVYIRWMELSTCRKKYCRGIACRGREGDDWRQINFTSSMTLKFFVQLLFVVLLVRAVDSCGPGRGHGRRRTARRSVYNMRFLSRCLQLQKLANYHAINR